MDIACIGEQVIDFLPGNEEGSYVRKAGGAPANVAIAAVRSGVTAGFCGKVGADEFGLFLQQILRDNGVLNLSPELIETATTTLAFVHLDKDGERTFTFARKPGADMFLTVQDVKNSGLTKAHIVHAGSCSLSKGSTVEATRYAISSAKEEKRLVSFDVNYRDLLWDGDREAARAAVKEILPMVDLLKISEEEVDFLDMERPEDLWNLKTKIPLIVLTRAERGAVCLWRGKVIEVGGLAADCVDATGAGDAFWGGFLATFVREGVRSVSDLDRQLIRKAARFGNVAGWLCVQKMGAIAAIPTLAAIEEKYRELANED